MPRQISRVTIEYSDGTFDFIPPTAPVPPPVVADLRVGELLFITGEGQVGEWEFGDGVSVIGFNAIHRYSTAGRYSVWDGKKTTVKVVGTDNRPSVTVGDRDTLIAGLTGGANRRIILRGGTYPDLPSIVVVGEHVSIEAYPGETPVLVWNVQPGKWRTGITVKGKNFSVEGLTFQSDKTPGDKAETRIKAINVTSTGSAYIGHNTFRDMDAGLWGGNYLAEYNKFTNLRAHGCWIGGEALNNGVRSAGEPGTDLVIRFNVFTDSYAEHPIRSNWIGNQRLNIYANKLTNSPRLDTGQPMKECITLREAKFAYVFGNDCTHGGIQAGRGDADMLGWVDQDTHDIVITDNVLRDGAWVQVCRWAKRITVSENSIVSGEPAYVQRMYYTPVRIQGPVSDVRVEHNTLEGTRRGDFVSIAGDKSGVVITNNVG